MAWHNNTEEEYREAAKNSKSIAGMCRYLGRNPYGAGYYTMHKKIKEYNIDISHFTGRGWNIEGKNLSKSEKISDENVFVENSTYTTSRLKDRLIKGGYKKEMCEKCGRTEWEGEPIPLQTHHINGIHNDNRIENLKLLCPNCHAQTENYCSKNVKKEQKIVKKKDKKTIEKICPICGNVFMCERNGQKYCSMKCAHKAQAKMPGKAELSNLVKNKTNIEISKIYGVSECSVRNWRKKYNI